MSDFSIPIKSIALDQANLYSTGSYPSQGFYAVNDRQIIFCNKKTNFCAFVCDKSDVTEQGAQDRLSENLFLKTIALLTDKAHIKDL